MIFNMTGGGASLNFQVKTYPSETELKADKPKENTIGVITTTTMTSWVFSATEPKEPEVGMVWISVGDASGFEFNALKGKTLQVYPLSAKQYYSNKWNDVTPWIYQGSEWKLLGLPSDYQEVAYLRSSGTQAIDTGYIQNENTEFVIDLNYTFAQWDWPMGVVSGDNYFGIQLGYQTNAFSFFFGRSNNKYGSTVTGGVRHKMEYKNGAFYIDNAKMGDYAMVQASTKHSVFLFAESTDGAIYGGTDMYLYRFTVSEKGKVLHDFVPCYRKSDSVAGMYDIVGRKFHTNIGTGTFVVGGDV